MDKPKRYFYVCQNKDCGHQFFVTLRREPDKEIACQLCGRWAKRVKEGADE